jgi:hypothetical protein
LLTSPHMGKVMAKNMTKPLNIFPHQDFIFRGKSFAERIGKGGSTLVLKSFSDF